jgi:hypothetical protein
MAAFTLCAALAAVVALPALFFGWQSRTPDLTS